MRTLLAHKILFAAASHSDWLGAEECSALGLERVVVTDLVAAQATLDRSDPFAIAILDPSLAEFDLFLSMLARHARECVWIALEASSQAQLAGSGSGRHRFFEVIHGSEDPAQRRALLQRAVREAQRRTFLGRHHDEHSFARGVLHSFSDILEEMLESHVEGLRELERFLSALGKCRDQAHLRGRVEAVCRAVCQGRTVRFELGVRARHAVPPNSWPLPVEGEHGPLGCLYLLADRSSECAVPEPRPRERLFLSAIASATAMALEHLERSHERDEAQQATILALAKLAEQRDNETGRHLLRVSEFCRLLALGLRARGWQTETITDHWVDILVRSAPLHDIGKVGIPDQILLKPARLDPDEWAIMKTHTTIGAQTLEDVMSSGQVSSFLLMSRDIALAHHERWDGEGYPRGLKGDAIPLAARIVTVADVYDALTSVRPYKPAWPHERARQTILDGAGTQFDPQVIEVFAALDRELTEVALRLADHDGTSPIASRVLGGSEQRRQSA